MSQPHDGPDWSLLPHDPAGFFGLGNGFDRRELRRSYNQLIRRFKPEKFPQEFQRIRAAFEQLDSDIRYGQQPAWSGAPEAEYQWGVEIPYSPDAAENGSATSSQRPTPVGAGAVSLRERLQFENVSDLYHELAARTLKSPFDYYALAVISDVVDGNPDSQFATWLLQGLAVHENDIGLLHLLQAYLRGPVQNTACEQLLVECSKIIQEDSFFPFTEPLWRKLLCSQNFSRFRAALEQCEASLQGINIDSRLAFYLQILKSAIWIADDAWIDESIELIERNFERIPQFLDFDVEIVIRLRAYIAHRHTFAGGHPMLRQLDGALRDYFSEEQVVGDRSVLACQLAMTQDPCAIADAFANFEDPAFAPFYAVWIWVTYDVGERHIEATEELPDELVWHPRAKLLFEKTARQIRNSRFGIGWTAATCAFRFGQAMCFLTPVLMLGMLSAMVTTLLPGEEGVVILAAIIPIILGLLIGRWLNKQLENRAWNSYNRRVSTQCYRQVWQPELIEFTVRSHLTYQTLMAFADAEFGPYSSSLWVKQYIDRDYALPLLANAQRFIV